MAFKDTTLAEPNLIRLYLYARLGLYSRVARRLGVDRSHVRRVALGERKSRRIAKAIEREIARLEKELTGAAA